MDQQNSVPRVKSSDIQAAIRSEYYFTALEGVRLHKEGDGEELGLVTICVLVLGNGYKVVGHSCCASPAMFNPTTGRELAREHAFEQIWPLLGYQLKDALHREAIENQQGDLFHNLVGDEL